MPLNVQASKDQALIATLILTSLSHFIGTVHSTYTVHVAKGGLQNPRTTVVAVHAQGRPSQFVDQPDYHRDSPRNVITQEQSHPIDHAKHIDAPIQYYMDETHVIQPEIISHQEIIHKRPIDIVHRPIILQEQPIVYHEDNHLDGSHSGIPKHRSSPENYDNEDLRYQDHSKPHAVVLPDRVRHYDYHDASYHDKNQDWNLHDRESEAEFADDNDVTRSIGSNTELHNGTDSRKSRVSASLTAIVNSADSHDDNYQDHQSESTSK